MALILGTAQFGLAYGVANQSGQIAHQEAQAILDVAAASGVMALDTAVAYGQAEQILGQLNTHQLPFISKLPVQLPAGESNCERWVVEQVEASLKRLNRSSLAALLFHRPEQLLSTAGPSLVRALNELRNAGVVHKLGLSVYSYAQVQAVLPFFRPDVVQLPFNVLDQRAAQLGWFKQMHSEGMEIHVRSAFLQGLLLMPPSEVPAYFAPWQNVLSQWHELCAQSAIAAQQICLQHVKQQPEVSAIVVGVDSSLQLQQIAQAHQAVASLPSLHNLSMLDEGLINPSNWKIQERTS
ncbi:MAG TPA: aldo/keto reductase [Limnobacter sp.]|nr:aldo/keto reductase [Limnobacter sp.]